MKTMIVALIALALCACASTPDPNYARYVQAHAEQDARDSARLDELRATATACADDTCRVAIAGFAALATQGAGGKPGPQPYVPQQSTAAKVGLALIGQLSPLANAAVAWHQSDNSVETARAQYDFLGGVVGDIAAVASGATAAAASAAPRIDVGGDYIVGDGNATRDAQIGDRSDVSASGDIVGRDNVRGHEVIGDENRFESPGPYDYSNDGDDCEGANCQGVPPPEEG